MHRGLVMGHGLVVAWTQTWRSKNLGPEWGQPAFEDSDLMVPAPRQFYPGLGRVHHPVGVQDHGSLATR